MNSDFKYIHACASWSIRHSHILVRDTLRRERFVKEGCCSHVVVHPPDVLTWYMYDYLISKKPSKKDILEEFGKRKSKRMSLKDSLEAAKKLKPQSSSPPSLDNLDIGNSFELDGNTYLVKDVYKYTEYKKKKKKFGESWSELELFCIDTGETKYMEVEVDDDIVVYFTDETKLKLKDIGIKNEDHLDSFVDDEEDINGYYYEDDYYAVFERNREKENLWIVEYEKEDSWLCIEGWETEIANQGGTETDDDEYYFEVSKGRILKHSDFKVLS